MPNQRQFRNDKVHNQAQQIWQFITQLKMPLNSRFYNRNLIGKKLVQVIKNWQNCFTNCLEELKLLSKMQFNLKMLLTNLKTITHHNDILEFKWRNNLSRNSLILIRKFHKVLLLSLLPKNPINWMFWTITIVQWHQIKDIRKNQFRAMLSCLA